MKENESPDPEWSLRTLPPEDLSVLIDMEEFRKEAGTNIEEQIKAVQQDEDSYIPLDTASVAEEMGLKHGDTFEWDGQPQKVVSIDTRMDPRDRDSLTLTDPTSTHPSEPYSLNNSVPLFDLFEAWNHGKVKPKQITLE